MARRQQTNGSLISDFPRRRLEAWAAERYAAFLRLFSDVLFAVSLFAVWGLLTLIGVIIDQGKPEAFYLAIYPTPLARAITRLGLDTIYHGAAYIGIIGAILVSLAVCTFKRVIPARLPPLRAVAVEHVPLNARLHWTGDEAVIRTSFTKFLRDRGWQIRARTLEGVEWTFADRANWARRGVLVAHIGFVILAAGTCIYWARGYSGDFTTLTGATSIIPQTRARVALDDFHYRIDPIMTKSGIVYQPIDYVSQVRVTGADGVTRRETIRVNHPLELDGVSIYQSAYGVGARLSVTHDGKPVTGMPDKALQEGDAFTLPGTTRSIEYSRFVGTIGADGLPDKDPRPNKPGAVLSVFDGNVHAGDLLVPFGRSVELGGGFSVTPRSTQFYSGFQYRYDPGIPLVGIGAFVLLAGLCISFYLLPARLYARIDGREQSWTISLAATTVKGYVIFEEQFADLVRALNELEPSHLCATPAVPA